jgi:hypothetical protein
MDKYLQQNMQLFCYLGDLIRVSGLRSASSGEVTGILAPSLKPQIIIHRDLDVLLRPQIAFGGLDRGMPEQELDLLQIPAILAAELGAGAAQVVGAEVLVPDLFG